jgi:membrane protein implicated in regulation of membrane protease activity
MISLAPFEWALLAALILAGLEVLTGTYVALGLALGCLAVAMVDVVTGGAGLYRDVILFVITAFLAVIALRRAFARPGDSKPAKGDVNEY